MTANGLLTTGFLAILLVGCSKPYEFSGRYIATQGNDCKEVDSGDNIFITISPESSDNADTLYSARLSSEMSGGGIFPVDSKPAYIDGDGKLSLSFYKQGKSGFFSSKPDVDMVMTLEGRDAQHIWVKNWRVNATHPKNPSLGGKFDFVNDSKIEMMGRSSPNELSQLKGDDGLCLKKLTA